jgi:uncharacterized protein (TIGR03546 family)
MLLIFKMIRGILKAITSQAEPWQVGLAAFFGTLLGFMPIMPSSYGICPLGIAVLVLAILVNCHFGTVLLFLALGKAFSFVLAPVALALGNACDSLARWASDVPILYSSLWSHTGYLGLTLMGLILAPFAAFGMAWFTVWFRAKIAAKLAERKALVKAGKVAGNAFVFKVLVWFLGLA